MQVANSQIAAMLRTAVRSPKLYAWMQLPLITDPTLYTVDYSKLGSQLILDKILSCRLEQYLTPGQNTCNIVISNQEGSLSPISPSSKFGRYFYPGAIDNKIAIYTGLSDSSGNETIAPHGIFTSQTNTQESTKDSNKMTIVGMDGMVMFNRQDIFCQFPPTLYGNQASSYYNPAYALNNPSGDLQTWVCDATNWMTSSIQAPLYAAEFQALAVYVGTESAPAGTPTTHAYVANYVTGTITFSAPLPSGSIVSVDATPLAMSPENMILHLFRDYGQFDPSFMKLDCSGIMLGRMAYTEERTPLDISTDIVSATAARGIIWSLFFDELGYLNFREINMDAAPVAVLVDERDILSHEPQYDSTNAYNVVRAQATSINQQPLEVVSYDENSINIIGQTATYDIPFQVLNACAGMDPGSAITYMTGVTSSQLFSNSTPFITSTTEVLFNPLYQVGDVLTIIEQRTGTAGDYYINQITKEFDGATTKMSLQLLEFKKSQDFNFGLAANFGSPNPTSGSNGAEGQGALVQQVSIAGTQVVQNGQPVTDAALNPVIASWNGGSLAISITTATPSTGAQTALWRWIYLGEDAYQVESSGAYTVCTGNGNSSIFPTNPEGPVASQVADLTGAFYGMYNHCTLPYDFRANNDTPNARRYFWPLIRCTDWVSGDGVLGSGGTFNSTWTGGVTVSGNIQLYGNLRVGLSDYFGGTTSGYSGVELFGSGTPGASIIGGVSNNNYGVDFGVPVTGKTMFYGIKRKVTPAYLCILVATTSGAFAFKRIPFQLLL